jgi:DNA-binding MarR family transcriptional regulator
MRDLTTALARYRHAESQLRHRKGTARGSSATESRALTFIYAGADEGALRTPKDLAAHLHLSSASITVLVDRLTEAGLVTRVRHPTDRRRISVIPAEHRIDPVSLAGRLNTLTQSYTGHDAATIAAFLNQLTELITEEEAVSHAVQSAS